jgi:hypothetical protein
VSEPTPRPWDQRGGESSAAFAAFILYRDMGPTRALSEVAEAMRRRRTTSSRSELVEGDTRATRGRHRRPIPGYLSHWSRDFEWASRASAWDAQLQASAAESVTKAAAESNSARAAWLLKLRDDDVGEAIEDADMVIKQGRYLSRFPAKTERREGAGPAGETLVVEAANASIIRTGMILIQVGRDMKRQAIRDGLAAVLPSAVGQAPVRDESEPPRGRPLYIEICGDSDGRATGPPPGLGPGPGPAPGPGVPL